MAAVVGVGIVFYICFFIFIFRSRALAHNYLARFPSISPSQRTAMRSEWVTVLEAWIDEMDRCGENPARVGRRD